MSDKLNKNINESMLEGLLSDSDKPKPVVPPQAAPSYGTGYGAYRHRSWDDDDDEDYMPNGRGRSAHVPAQRSIFEQRTTYPSSTQPTSYAGGKDISAATINAIKDALAAGLHSGQKHYFLDEKSANHLANGVVRGIGELFDAVGLCWGASGSKAAKALVFDMLTTNVFYNTPTRGYKELDFGGEVLTDAHDPETGEVIDAERKAIMEVDGGVTFSEEE